MTRNDIKPALDCDVLVAGAGPAGAAAATRLAAAGLRVILADWQAFPRDKVCGDFVSPVAVHELQALGITRGAGHRRSHMIREAAVHLDGAHLLTSAIPTLSRSSTRARVIPRKTLDEWIVTSARTAGAQMLEGCRITAFQVHQNGVEVTMQEAGGTRTLRTHVLIRADGSTSVVARSLRGNTPEEDRIIAIRGYFDGVVGPSDRAALYFSGDNFPGYCWLFPTSEGTANVGIGMMSKTLPPASDHLRSMLLQRIEQDVVLKARLSSARLRGQIAGWPLTTYNPRLPIVGDRVVLVGDAAGLINPLNGEGIQSALLSARWAAETVVTCARCGDFSRTALGAYAVRVDADLGRDMAVSRTLIELIRNRSLNPLWLEALRIIITGATIDADYAEVTGGVLAGVVPARHLLTIPVIRRTVEQAALRLGSRTLQQLSFRPNDLASLGVNASSAAINFASTMLKHPADAKRWMINLTTSVLDILPHIGGHKEKNDGTEKSSKSHLKPERRKAQGKRLRGAALQKSERREFADCEGGGQPARRGDGGRDRDGKEDAAAISAGAPHRSKRLRGGTAAVPGRRTRSRDPAQ